MKLEREAQQDQENDGIRKGNVGSIVKVAGRQQTFTLPPGIWAGDGREQLEATLKKTQRSSKKPGWVCALSKGGVQCEHSRKVPCP